MRAHKVSAKNLLSNKKDIKLHVLGPVMDCSHNISDDRLARLLYSASALDLATSVCFLDHQETRLGPTKMQAPDVDLLSSGSDA
ncbi:hypothetical protein L195_g060622, partial [Trifolium pratense]